ncbi:unnamed protein product [Symbiodinium necroappetens]|uniref:SET domain-containing protein n=1 Tax=Symbiodinium necroappetens TaxID=1628268 RepID=A0A812MXN3_9DINO|nr:unnamed protein product [Symbiodinium necroappetens]
MTGSGTNGSGLWIFTRDQKRDEALVQKVRAIAAQKGFDLSVLNDVDQSACGSITQDTSCDFLQKRQGETRWGFGALARVICEILGSAQLDQQSPPPAMLPAVLASDFQVRVEPTEDLAKGELGIVATSKLVPGDILAWAPTSLLLSKPKAVELWGDVVEALSDQVALILLLIQERYVHGKDSKWYVYMRSLPQFDGDVSGPSFLWTEDELEWLQGSDGYGAAAAMYNTIVDEYVTLNESLFQEHSEKFPSSALGLQKHLADRDQGVENHRAGALQLTRFGNGIVAYAHKHYDVGEQVWVSYGGKSNAELLSQHLPFFRMVQGQIARIDAPKLSEPMLQGSEGCNKGLQQDMGGLTGLGGFRGP